MQRSFAEGDLVAGARLTQWNTVRLIYTKQGYRLTKNHDHIATYTNLDKALEAFEKQSHLR